MTEKTDNQLLLVLGSGEWVSLVGALNQPPEANDELRVLLSKIPPWCEGA